MKVAANVALPGTGRLEAKLTERDRELAREINRVNEAFAFPNDNYPTLRQVGWRDLIGDINVRGTAGAATPAWTAIAGLGGLFAYEFSATVNKEVWINYHVDHDYAMGTAIYLHTHWLNSAASPNTGTVTWGFEYTLAKGHQQTAFPATETVYATQTCSGTRYMHHIAEISLADAVPGTNIEPDTLILVRIFRDAVNDTCSDAVHLLLADCHYQADRFSTMNKSPDFYTPHVDMNISMQPGVVSFTGAVPTVVKTP